MDADPRAGMGRPVHPGRSAGSALHAMESVCSDQWYGAHLAVDHLVGLGHRRMVFATRDDGPTVRTVRAALSEIAAAHPLVEGWAWVPGSSGSGAEAQRDGDGTALSAASLREPGVTAAVLHGNVDALMIVQWLAASGARVPRNCSAVAYDNVVVGLGTPPLTAVSPPKGEVGRVAAEVLPGRLDGSYRNPARPVQRTELWPTLTVRGSTRERTSAP
ncbi:substrate-binding domain-containing protein [Streptomyces chiangmaiensis]|uniref:Substrate-binding domain-containing protein n=1 Tax=Streptomyces chiangmaiensis TaxID=766497 RepID=A0ABU7FC55_9ACTN|nr:substrate-binding domain-containing protein [Streptomyces chiangmaiensis]MED7821747.1 substrate-binding domain-containing protein [Streptomyces chiangmaiensis]